MSNTTNSTFMKLFKTDVSKYTEKKGKFSYLSWAYAVQELKRACPTARWGVTKAEDGSPFFVTQCGYFVDVWVEVDGVSLSQIHPVLDHRNQPIEQPNAFQINTSLQRALAKAIALHGLGLYIFAGEDLPEPDIPVTTTSLSRGISTSISFKLCVRAPRMRIVSIYKNFTIF